MINPLSISRPREAAPWLRNLGERLWIRGDGDPDKVLHALVKARCTNPYTMMPTLQGIGERLQKEHKTLDSATAEIIALPLIWRTQNDIENFKRNVVLGEVPRRSMEIYPGQLAGWVNNGLTALGLGPMLPAPNSHNLRPLNQTCASLNMRTDKTLAAMDPDRTLEILNLMPGLRPKDPSPQRPRDQTAPRQHYSARPIAPT